MTHVAAPAFNSAAASEVSYPEAVGGGRWLRVVRRLGTLDTSE
jgi:hypothetical protein